LVSLLKKSRNREKNQFVHFPGVDRKRHIRIVNVAYKRGNAKIAHRHIYFRQPTQEIHFMGFDAGFFAELPQGCPGGAVISRVDTPPRETDLARMML